ncbi:MAG TPA: DUF6799 domain-containing protein [Flavisolibacter sp.]|jgi:hypothetical protein
MKKTFALAAISASLFACNSSETSTTTSVDTDSAVTTTTSVTDTSNTTNTNTTTSTSSYTAADGDVSYRGGKVMVWRNGDWVESKEDVTLDNGVVVRRNGEVRRDKDVINLEEGEVVNRTGNFFDKAGNAIEDGWDATKRGAKKAGNAIEKGAKKVGEETKDVFDGKDDKDGNN